MTAEPPLSSIDVDYYRAILGELTSLGAELARALRRVPPPDDVAVQALRTQTGNLLRLATIYERLSRAIRCTIRLDQCFAEEAFEKLDRKIVVRVIAAICGDLHAACAWLPDGLRPRKADFLPGLRARASAPPAAGVVPFKPRR